MGKLAKILSGVKAVSEGLRSIKQPKIKTKKARDIIKKGGMIGSKIKKSTTTIKGINPRTRSRIGKGDTQIENLSTIVDVKLPKEPAFLRRRMTIKGKK
tara:strand:+ start:50 stop:346 length:297 start_codon:yes stop_codon:yes gene_type:complete